ncbi:membrane-spanning 4-domains subfamily A member 4A-like isoform X2 [Erpetoichthys calabaricus]|uniref:membrane-spanning 4-domains subfamily A member 4A-like isoform X2 n=1 Tax=Erpetoichthys calabaricus TaxID=27687 RepID=UPI00223486E0|nr:membrane-spanning 4-domains subfamily A member 4A-like isoform X2 [Erpetoichthys calabaricus]
MPEITQSITFENMTPVNGVVTQVTNTRSVFKRFLKGKPEALGYIISGSFCVIAAKTTQIGWIKAALSMNITSAVSAVFAVAMYCANISTRNLSDRGKHFRSNDTADLDHVHWHQGSYILLSTTNGILGVLLIFTVLEFLVAISMSVFGCKAVCKNTMPVIVIQQSSLPEAAFVVNM